MPEYTNPPHPPENIDISNFKKSWSPEVANFLAELVTFAKETGVWVTVLNALADESYFVNQTNQAITENHQAPSFNQFSENHTSQGLVLTGYEGEKETGISVVDVEDIFPEIIEQTLTAWLYHLAIFNHPVYLDQLYQTADQPFEPPNQQFNFIMWWNNLTRQALSIHDLTLAISPADKPRLSRTAIFTQSLTVSYWQEQASRLQKLLRKSGRKKGREQARNIFVMGENPDVTGTSLMLATMAASHHLIGIPRDGKFKDPVEQAKLASDSLALVKEIAKLFGRDQQEQQKLADWYSHNLIGILESKPSAAVERAQVLYAAGIRTFRVYSPEPNNQLVATVQAITQTATENDWEEIEIFAGQVVSVDQAQELEKAGTNALYLGVGGGGRCTTGKVANLAIDWPQLLWQLRGKIKIPVIVQGGGNDNPVTSLALGASGIGIVGKAAATLEAPGGSLYFYDAETGELFNFYGGEASNRLRGMVDRVDPLGRAINTEGETTIKHLIYEPESGIYPTSLQRVTELIEALATGLVFQNTKSISELQAQGPKNLRRESSYMSNSREAH